MFKHLRYTDGEVEFRSKAGEFTVDALDLNASGVVRWRRTIIAAADATGAKLNDLLSTKAQVEKLLAKASPADRDQMLRDMATLDISIERLSLALKNLGAD
jgi:hypothetical protein